MKKLIITITSLLIAVAVSAQTSEAKVNPENDNMIFTVVENPPTFKGGIQQFASYLGKTIRYPAAAREKNTQGRVVVAMVVEKDGSLSQIHVVRGVGDGCDEEAVRVMRLCPKWNPGTQNGVPVRTAYTLPISFTLSE